MDIFDDGPFETGDESEMNPNLVPAPDNSYLGKMLSVSHDSVSFRLHKEAYRGRCKQPFLCPFLSGFSLDSGKSLTTKGQLTVVAGAPRANHSGAVVLLKKDPNLRKLLLEEYILEGEGLASSFGYDLTVLDLNGDR